MVCSSNDLVAWRDFPKGLRVLLLVEDGPSAVETKLKLEEMNYVVSSFYNGKDAFEVISEKHENFHVAVVEVTTTNSDGSFRFLEMAKDLPTVVISNIHCLSTMMKCIALGAVEFLQNPISEDKLKNIWQHVVHKAFNAGGDVLSKSLKPVKETVVSMLQLQSETGELKIEVPTEMETSERFSAPSTPQLKQGVRFVGEEQPKEKEVTTNATELISNFSESKSVDNTCNNLINVVSNPAANEVAGGEEVDSSDGSKTSEWSNVNSNSQKEEDPKKKKLNLSVKSNSHGHRLSRKSMKVDWTSELHRKFVQAVEQLGIDQAIPSKILELMKVEGLTRHNVASHLQKFRMNRRHILPKDDGNRWRSHRDPMSTCYASKPLVAFPPIQRNYDLPPNLPYRIWGHPSYPPPGLPLWGNSGYPPWHPPPEHWLWNTHQGINADAWGCPIAPPYSQWSLSQAPPMSNYSDVVQDESRTHDPNWEVEKVIDEAVTEAVSKPWLPLPLGLKPPSVDGVLAELHRQGLRTVPPSNSTPAAATTTAAKKS